LHPLDPAATVRPMSYILTLVADRAAATLDHPILDRVRDAIGGGTPDILSAGEAVDISCSLQPDMNAVRQALEGAPIDAIAIGSDNRRKNLLIADMDSTIVTGETLDELADFAGLKQKISAITRRSMNGELDFTTALRERVAMLKGLEISALERTWRRMALSPGARDLVTTMRAHGAITVLVSGGFTFFTSRVAALAGFHHHCANTLEDDGNALTGRLGDEILDQHAKLAILRSVSEKKGIPLSTTLAIGDGANDLPMLRTAGLGIAYRAKPVVAAQIEARLDHATLRGALFVQGYRARDISQG
jgi:phosphoserine phosphatase